MDSLCALAVAYPTRERVASGGPESMSIEEAKVLGQKFLRFSRFCFTLEKMAKLFDVKLTL